MTDTKQKDPRWSRADGLLVFISNAMVLLTILAVVIFFAGVILMIYPAPSCAALQLVGLCK